MSDSPLILTFLSLNKKVIAKLQASCPKKSNVMTLNQNRFKEILSNNHGS